MIYVDNRSVVSFKVDGFGVLDVVWNNWCLLLLVVPIIILISLISIGL